MASSRSCKQSIYGKLSCACADAVAVDLTYNLGCSGMKGFPNFISQMKSGQYAAAASNLQGTLWCKQVGRRCPRNVN